MNIRMGTRYRWMSVAGLLLAAVTGACDDGAAPGPNETEAAPEAHGHGDDEDPAAGTREWAELRPPSDLSLLELPAHVQAGAESLTHVELPFDAVVESVDVAVGDAVEAGAPLLVLRSPGLAEAAATMAAASAQIGTHETRRAHLDELRAEGIVDASAVFEIDARLGSLDAERRRARTVLESLGLDRADLRALRKDGRVTLRARSAGVVTEIEAHPGETVAAGRSVATVRGAGRARIEVAYFGALPESLRLEFVGLDGGVTELNATPVARSIEPGMGRTLAWFEPSTEAQMPDGLVGKVRIIGLDAGVFELPARSLRMHEGEPKVLRRGAERGLEAIAVEVLRRGGASALVRSEALKVGDFVAADASAVLDYGRESEGGGHQH